LYYLEDFTQAEIARRLGMSRATVSRVLSEARRQGIVKIEIAQPPTLDRNRLAVDTAGALGLAAVHICDVAVGPSGTVRDASKPALSMSVSEALSRADLRPGDVLLTSSGRMVHAVAECSLPRLAGVVVAPMIGGQDEPEPWYQPNEICRRVAETVGGRPSFLYAPALPGPDLDPVLRDDPSIRRVVELWRTARCAIVGVGAPPLARRSLPRFVPTDAVSLRDAVGDVCSRFYDADGVEVSFPGGDRLMSIPLETLREIRVVIAVATGLDKVNALVAGARSHYFNNLVTDPETAAALLEAARAPGPTAVGTTRPDSARPAPAS
jgi:DNA-binding transcriptional regulator LsrR (DeoR family)